MHPTTLQALVRDRQHGFEAEAANDRLAAETRAAGRPVRDATPSDISSALPSDVPSRPARRYLAILVRRPQAAAR